MLKRWMAGLGLVALLVVGLGTLPAGADEGMWLPPEFGKSLPVEQLRKMGFQLEPGELWNDSGDAVKDAVLQVVEWQPDGSVFGFGSAAFVSGKGLILTNHHVAFDAITANSTAEHNYVEEGFRAGNMSEEVSCPNTGVRICVAFEDVTARVLDGVEPGMDEAKRAAMVADAVRAVESEAEARGLRDVEVKEMYEGLKYYLTAYDTFRDVRLVYAPARAIGEYGGDTDNWIWPRHTGDYTYLRAYVAPDGSRAEYADDNVPYEPKRFLKVSTAGVDEGDFSFIMGFPGTTYRARSSYSLEYRERVYYPRNLEAIAQQVKQLEDMTAGDTDARLGVLSRIKSLNNTLKNFQGALEGLKRYRLVDMKRKEEQNFRDWVAADAGRSEKYGDVFPAIERLYEAVNADSEVQAAITGALRGSVMAFYPGMVMMAQDRESPTEDTQLTPERRMMMLAAVKSQLETMDLDQQRESFGEALAPFAAIEDARRPESLRGVDLSDMDAAMTRLLPEAITGEDLEAMAKASLAELRTMQPFIHAIGIQISEQALAQQSLMMEFNTRISVLRRRLAEAWAAFEGTPQYPDADSTLRFTYGKIRGYSPRDAVWYDWKTTARGVVEKHSGEEPFIAPEKLRELVAKKAYGRWADAKTGELVCDFIADTDITGGNSGSPTMNARGEMVGIAFDGNYEAMTSDYHFQPEITRTISVDIRYVMWCTEMVDGMTWLIDEMTFVK